MKLISRISIGIGAVCLYLCGTVASAAPYYCATTHNFVNVGDSLDQVKTACGSPESEQTTQMVDVQQQPVQQWFYHQNSSLAGKDVGGDASVSVFFSNGKVSSIQSQNQQFSSLQFCSAGGIARSGAGVSVGDTPAMVRAKCGNPASANVGTQKNSSGVKDIVVLTYNNGQYSPKTTMRFIEGKLAEISVGP